jgi:4-amino-4-deoxy-L-arabinose transferase-like glycosyltransferase
MESSGSHGSRLLTAGGILSIVSGASEATWGAINVYSIIDFYMEWIRPVPHSWSPAFIYLTSVVMSIFALGIVAIIGGVSAMRRRIFGLSLAGAICCQVSSVIYAVMSFFGWPLVGGVVWALAWLILGLLAIIFICLSKKEFETRGEQSGI